MSTPLRNVCPNCGQWQHASTGDCLHECAARGFAPYASGPRPRITTAYDSDVRFIGYRVLNMGAVVATFLFADYPEGSSGAFIAAEVERDHVEALWVEANTDPLKLTPEERADERYSLAAQLAAESPADKAAREQYEADTETLRDHE